LHAHRKHTEELGDLLALGSEQDLAQPLHRRVPVADPIEDLEVGQRQLVQQLAILVAEWPIFRALEDLLVFVHRQLDLLDVRCGGLGVGAHDTRPRSSRKRFVSG
jgi:hypothetical protein